MTQALLILSFLLVTMPEMFAARTTAPDPLRAIGWTLSLHALVALAGQAGIAACAKVVDRKGSVRAVRVAESIARIERLGAVAVHAVAVIWIGWLPAVRAVFGDFGAVDALIAVLPVPLVWMLSWWSIEPIERRLREATLYRDLELGAPVHTILSRPGFVIMSLRHQVLFVMVPITVMLVWSDLVAFAGDRWWPRTPGPGAAARAEWRQAATGLAQAAGVAAVFLFMPLVLRIIWDTVPLGPGDLRSALDRLSARCRVRVREMLVWRTNGLLINGAAVGLFRPLRYVLLTDALLERLSPRQVEAVAAHEFAHVRRHHMLWLGVTMLATVTLAGLGVDAALAHAGPHAQSVLRTGSALQTAAWPLTAGLLVLVFFVFGFVSRRFEWQADAFAVAALSEGPDGRITADGALAMSSALGAVARLNGIPLRQRSWRHGSIATRQGKIQTLVGQPVDRLQIDRTVRILKIVAAVALAAGIVTTVVLNA